MHEWLDTWDGHSPGTVVEVATIDGQVITATCAGEIDFVHLQVAPHACPYAKGDW
ncbi:MAG: hypothetical protein ABSD75_05490 [Terriglobales bacterium]